MSGRLSLWLRLLIAVAGIGILSGLSSGAFLLALEWATTTREQHRWLIALLPLAGLLIGVAYWRWGRDVEAGVNRVLEEVHEPRAVIPGRMTPMIFVATTLTHLCGGSAGREGVAVQMGASLGDQLVRVFRFPPAARSLCLMAGISGGFAAIFGTPWAGALFALEVLAIGALRWQGAAVCLVAAHVGHQVCLALPIAHTHYDIGGLPTAAPMPVVWTAIFGVACGLLARAFVLATHGVTALAQRCAPWPPLRLVVGGCVVAVAVWLLGTTRHIGLGIPLIQESFTTVLPLTDLLLKLALTAITIGVGFKGGEVTPLFCVGALLGSSCAGWMPLPTALLAGLGFVAVFAGAANAPLACMVMAVELFGVGVAPWAALACACAWVVSGHRGIYSAQRIAVAKPLHRRA